MWYEKRFNTIVSEFGCIKHPKINFLGASPDGINIKSDNPRYGRVLEIMGILSGSGFTKVALISEPSKER